VGFRYVYWIEANENNVHWRILVNAVMKYQI